MKGEPIVVRQVEDRPPRAAGYYWLVRNGSPY